MQVQNVTADYIMKCDDDTFVRLDIVLQQISTYNRTLPLYLGNLNLLHRPLRRGKWAVTYEVPLAPACPTLQICNLFMHMFS